MERMERMERMRKQAKINQTTHLLKNTLILITAINQSLTNCTLLSNIICCVLFAVEKYKTENKQKTMFCLRLCVVGNKKGYRAQRIQKT